MIFCIFTHRVLEKYLLYYDKYCLKSPLDLLKI